VQTFELGCQIGFSVSKRRRREEFVEPKQNCKIFMKNKTKKVFEFSCLELLSVHIWCRKKIVKHKWSFVQITPKFTESLLKTLPRFISSVKNIIRIQSTKMAGH
jgi:hypothetical protein